MGYDAPFEGLTVVDLSQGIAGPYCGMLLAQQGANVIKVEPVDGGDWARALGISYDGQTAYTITGNIGKRSLALDLKSDTGKDVLWQLAEKADVFMEGYRPGVISRLGFGYEDLSRRNPGVVYLSISGFGQAGPLAGRPALDPALQALTGMMSSNKGENSIPHRVMFISVDMATGLYLFQALSSALYARRDEDKGCYIDNLLMRSGPLPAKRAADRQYNRRRRDDARGRTARRLFDKRRLDHARCPTRRRVRAILRSDPTTGLRCRSKVRNSGQPSRTCRHSHTRNQRGHVARNIQILVRTSDRRRHRARDSERLPRLPRTPSSKGGQYSQLAGPAGSGGACPGPKSRRHHAAGERLPQRHISFAWPTFARNPYGTRLQPGSH